MMEHVRSSLAARASLVLALGCSAGAPPWPDVGGGGAGAAASMSAPSMGSAGAGATSSGASDGGAAAGAAGAAGAGAGTGGSAAGSTGRSEGPPPGTSLDPPPDAEPSAPPTQQCREVLQAVTEPPTVLVLADRSGSMFTPLDDAALPAVTAWSELRTTVLAAIQALEGEVRFGFSAYSGDGDVCPELTSVPPALDNHAAIAALYGSLEVPLRRNGGPPLAEAQAELALAGGDVRLWLITDGDVDYCDDGNPLCPVDSVVGALQRLARASSPIPTTVFGVTPLITSPLPPSALQAFARAGAGQPVALPALGPTATDPNAIFDQCSGVPDWASDFASTGKPSSRGQSVGDYAESDGPAVVHAPAGGDVGALVATLRSELATERRCAFDLAARGVSPSALATLDERALIELDGVPVAADEQNGWRRVGTSTLRLEGAACAAVRSAPATPALQVTWACTP